jgi:uncharacterized phiE125 gp8 family phage protein
MKTKLIAAPATFPVTLEETKKFYRVIGTDQDTVITRTIGSATAKAEQITNRQFVIATYEGYLDCFKDAVKVPKPPLVSVDKVEYIDVDGVTQLWTDYTVDDVVEPAVIYFDSFPSDVKTEGVNNVIVTFQCGYTEVPEPVQDFILNYGLTRFENREGEVIGTIVNDEIASNVKHLLDDYRIIPV